MQHFSKLFLLLTLALLVHTLPVQADSESIQITSASVICGKTDGFWGASYSMTTNYSANGERLIDEFLVVGGGGGRTDAFHHIEAGTESLSTTGGLAAEAVAGLPYTVDLTMELYAATTTHYDNGNIIIDGPLVARSTASAVCTQEGPTEVTIGSSSSSHGIDDGRINPDPAAPVAIYCHDYGIDVYRINSDSTGSLVFTATNEEIEAIGESPAENTLIDAYENIRLYRLTTGEFQVNAGPDFEGKEYVFIWGGC